ncbi:MAG: PQQ-binding-like beta-propeller repeat protein [Anaerolineales bacterium]|nr:PQQ-binding-like beta-propeller repeat protein [Anaerolineales bacterium]
MSTRQTISRRHFLKGAMATAGVGALAAFVRQMSTPTPALAAADVAESVAAQCSAPPQVGRQRLGASALLTMAQDDASAASWPMLAANPQRTSWSSEGVRGNLNPVWYRVIEPYIPPRVQIIAANGLLYISTVRGLYALYAATGATAWVYPTELPLGHSPTIYSGVAYVGGFDHKIHAINAQTGARRWTFEAGAGFDTNPLVLELNGRTMIYAGNRDGSMYAIEDLGTRASLVWTTATNGPIHFSAAYRDGVIYFASDDSYAYALNAQTGALVWRSAKLPGAGFQSWWPVLHQDPRTGADVVILAGSSNYRDYLDPGFGRDLMGRELEDVFPNRFNEPKGALIGSRISDGSINAARVLQYFEAKPWRRTVIVLHRATGQELTLDSEPDGKPEYAPFLWHGTHSGNRYPPIIGSDGRMYSSNVYMSDDYIPGGHITGWVVGSGYISTPSARWMAMDEPMAYSAGGDVIYWSHCNDRSAGAFDLSKPNTRFYPSAMDYSREWTYFEYDLGVQLPGYSVLYEWTNPSQECNKLFQGPAASPNGVYGLHGHQNPPIPYGGKVYIHRGNAVIALADYYGQPAHVPMAHTVAAPAATISITSVQLHERLAAEVRKILAAGHLRPGYRSAGLLDNKTRDQYGDHLIDYWHSPSEILYALALALPHLPADLQAQVKAYMQNEYAAYPPHQFTHVGWRDGVPREPYDLPAEAEADRINHPAWVSGYGYAGWTWPPHMFYALWKYAAALGSAATVFNASRSRLDAPPPDSYLIEYPYVHNAYIVGYLGYLKLEELAGRPESASVRATLDRLLALRAATFSKDTPYTGGHSGRAFSISRNFIHLVPQLAAFMRVNLRDQVEAAIAEYNTIAPYWFVANHDTGHGEQASQNYYDYHAIFLAKALILQQPGSELLKYLDVPAVQVGDLFYIQNLVATIEAGLASGLRKTATPAAGDQGSTITYSLSFSGYIGPVTVTDTLPAGVSAPLGYDLMGTIVAPTYSADLRRLTWHGTPVNGQAVTISYDVTVQTGETEALASSATLTAGDDQTSTAGAVVVANPVECYVPAIFWES